MKERYLHLDVIRGLAICTMLVANSAATFLEPEHPFWFRLIGTFAAPTFICMAGYLLGRGLIKEPASFQKSMYRGLLTLGIAASIDAFVWRTMPFTTFDVLYVIGFGICLFPLFSKLSKKASLLLCLAILILPQLIFRNEYCPEISSLTLDKVPFSTILHSVQTLFLDGWFPLFPWIGLMYFAVWVGRYSTEPKNQKNGIRFILSLVIFIGGIVALYFQDKITRDGYSELFYPPDFIYMLTAISLLSMIWQKTQVFNKNWLIPLTWLGRSSLFFYILHCILIKYLLPIIFPFVDENYALLLGAFNTLLFIIGYIINKLKQFAFWEKLPWLFRFILGN